MSGFPWHRVFGGEHTVEPRALLKVLGVRGQFRGDDLGWFQAVLQIDEDFPPLHLERYRSDEEGIRPELNAWAAWLETCASLPGRDDLIEKVATAVQVFTLTVVAEDPEDWEPEIRELARRCCSLLASSTGGVFQIDGEGFYAADGTLLIPEH